MAIPDNYIDKIKNKDSGESRIISPAADKVRVDNENFEGTDLDEVLDEVAQAIKEAGSGDGTVTGVKVGSTTYEPTDGVVDISTAIPDTSGLTTKTEVTQGLDGKVDKATGYGLSKNDYTDTDKTAVGTIASKANDADVVKSISVNGTVQQKNNGNVNIVVEGIQGEKGEKGDTGNVEFEDLEDLVALLVNDLTTGGAGNFLSAEMGKRLKTKIEEVYQRVQSIYSLLAGIAFTADKPAASSILPALDWGNPKHVVTFNLTLANVTVMRNGTSISNGTALSIEELTNLTLNIVPDAGLSFLSVPTVTFGGNSVIPTLNQDGSYSVEVTMPQTDVTMAIRAEATAIQTVTANTIDCTLDNVGNVGLGGSYSGQLTAASHSTMTDAYVKVTMNGNDVTSSAYDASTGEIEIATVTGDIVVEAIAVAVKPTDFLISNGNAYCDLGFTPTPTMSYRYMYYATSFKQFGPHVAGCYGYMMPFYRAGQGSSNPKAWYCRFGVDASGIMLNMEDGVANRHYEVIVGRDSAKKIFINGTEAGSMGVPATTDNVNLFAFTFGYDKDNTNYKLAGGIRFFEVFDLVNGVDTLIHRFVPDTQNGVNGFLDTVTNTFISSSTTTAFTKNTHTSA